MRNSNFVVDHISRGWVRAPRTMRWGFSRGTRFAACRLRMRSDTTIMSGQRPPRAKSGFSFPLIFRLFQQYRPIPNIVLCISAGLRFQTFDQMHQLPIWSKSDARCRVLSGLAINVSYWAHDRYLEFAFLCFRRNGVDRGANRVDSLDVGRSQPVPLCKTDSW